MNRSRPEYLDAHPSDGLTVGDVQSRKELDEEEDEDEEEKKGEDEGDEGDGDDDQNSGYSVWMRCRKNSAAASRTSRFWLRIFRRTDHPRVPDSKGACC